MHCASGHAGCLYAATRLMPNELVNASLPAGRIKACHGVMISSETSCTSTSASGFVPNGKSPTRLPASLLLPGHETKEAGHRRPFKDQTCPRFFNSDEMREVRIISIA